MSLLGELGYNFLQDCKKKEISKRDRATIISNMLIEYGCSLRELARRLDISHSTLQDWYMYNNVSSKEYNDLIKVGYTDKQIYKALRSSKTDNTIIETMKLTTKAKLKSDELSKFIYESNKLVKSYIRSYEIKQEAGLVDSIKDLVNNLNRLTSKLERKR